MEPVSQSMSLFVRCTSLSSLLSRLREPISTPSDEHPHSTMRRMLRVTDQRDLHGDPDMKLVARLFRGRTPANLTTEMERRRLSMTMPGQTAALAASRYGFLLN